jgi:tetratricopeptide (TPR) repeat protein
MIRLTIVLSACLLALSAFSMSAEVEMEAPLTVKITPRRVGDRQENSGPFAGDLLILTCRDFQDKKPVDVTDVFEPTDKRVYVYIKFTNVPSNTRYQVDVTWRDPDDDVYWNYDITIREHAEAGRYYWYYKWKRIKGDRAADLPGKWTVELRIQTYVNGENTATNHERANFFMRPKATLLQFADMTKVTGLADETGGECVAVGDYDGDGDADLYTGNLYRNNGDGTFTDATDAAGMQGLADAISATFGDVDGDDDLDLLVINTRAMALFQNNGDGIFTDMTSEAGIQSAVGAREVILADYDGDGAPDIYIAGVGANRLYHNNSNGTFQDVTEEASVGDAGWSEAAAFGDYDGDGRPDLYVANWGSANALYRNNGNGTFTDVTQTAGVGHDGSAKAAAWLDYDADGVLDLFVVNSYEQPDVLYRNNGNSTFTDVTETAGLDGKTWGEAFAFSDYDGDGDIDIYLVTSRGADVFYANNGDSTFTGNGIVGENADAAFFDMDSGGGLDLYVVQKDGQNVLYRSFRTYDEAVTAYQKIVEADPEDVAAHEYLARAYRRKGDLEKAIAGYEEIAKLRPDDVGAFETLGDMCEKQGDSGKAIAYYKEAIELAPNDSDLYEKLGDVYRDMGMLDEALAEYDASQAEPRTEIEQGSTNSCVYNKLAWFYVDKEIRPEEMLSLAKKAVELAPDTFKRSHLNVHLDTLGWAYFRNGQLDEALKTFFQVLSTDLDSQSGQSSWEGVSEIAQSAVKPEIFLWFYNEMTTALGESGENMVLQVRLHSALAQFYEHREEREKAQKEWVKTGFARDADWLVLGPFGNTGGADSSNVYLPEQSIDVRATYQGKDRKISWTAAKDELADAYVDLYEMFDESEWSVAFALAQVNSSEQREAQLRVGSSGDVKVWINGQEVLRQNTSRSAAIDQDIIPVSLKNGANEILVKVCSHSDDWGFYLRITDMEGTPYDDLNYTPATDLYDHEP